MTTLFPMQVMELMKLFQGIQWQGLLFSVADDHCDIYGKC